jgi:N-acetylglucosaminyldiphosphoundecaprenol N-acetyl-beta-D-mannosaminyltransferase
VRIDDLGLAELVDRSREVVAARAPATFAYANAHVLNVAYHDAELRRFLNDARVTYCDGFGVRVGALLKGRRLGPRVTGADWLGPYCRLAAEAGHRIFIVAGRAGVADEARRALVETVPGLRVVGASTGYLDDAASERVVRAINAAQADVVFVGMGTPRQERWVVRHRRDIRAPLVWVVGALFDLVAGRERRGPPWLTGHGFEWLVRLHADPVHRWRRYVLGNPLFLWRVLRERVVGEPGGIR